MKKFIFILLFLLVPFYAQALQVEDGKGSGQKQTVIKYGEDGFARTWTVVETEESYISEKHGDTYFYSSGSGVTPSLTNVNAGGYNLYLENESTTHILLIEKIMVSSQTSGVSFTLVKNLTLGTIANHDLGVPEPVNTNFASGNVSDTTEYFWREEGQGLGGLTGGTTMFTIATPASPVILPMDGTLVLSANDNIGLHITGISEVVVSIRYYFKEK